MHCFCWSKIPNNQILWIADWIWSIILHDDDWILVILAPADIKWQCTLWHNNRDDSLAFSEIEVCGNIILMLVVLPQAIAFASGKNPSQYFITWKYKKCKRYLLSNVALNNKRSCSENKFGKLNKQNTDKIECSQSYVTMSLSEISQQLIH